MKFLLEFFSNFAKFQLFHEITDQIRNFAKFLKYSVISRNYWLHLTVQTVGCCFCVLWVICTLTEIYSVFNQNAKLIPLAF